MSENFLLFTATIWAVCLVTMLVAYVRSRDPFHPALVISAQLLFLYGFLPYDAVQSGLVFGYLTDEQSQRVQWINMLGVVSLALGLLVNTHREESTSYLLLAEGTSVAARCSPERQAVRPGGCPLLRLHHRDVGRPW